MAFLATLRRALLENWKLKVLSLAIAFILYMQFHGREDSRRSIVVDLEALLPPETANRVLRSALPQSVRVTVVGSSRNVDDLRASALAVQLDLRSGRETHVNFDAKMIRARGLVDVLYEVDQFDPAGVDLTWEERISRDVPVQVSVVGTPAVGFVVKGIPAAEPAKISVRGPTSEVSVLQFVRVEGFDVSGLSEGVYPRRLGIERLASNLRAEPANALVTAEVTREIAERPFTKLAVVVTGIAKGRTLPPEVDVRLVCPPDTLRGLRPEQVVPRVDVTSKEPSGSLALPVVVSVDRCEAHVTPQNVVVKW